MCVRYFTLPLKYQKQIAMNTQTATATRLMIKYEKIIVWYNKKYSFDMSNATPKEQKEYNMMLNAWDGMKAKRDALKAAA